MDEKLKDIFTNINDWLKYAEAKSATLIAGNGALIFGLAGIIENYKLPKIIECSAYLSIACCVISMILCLLSIVPSLSMPWENKPVGTNNNDNLLYFQHIAKYTPNNYLVKLSKKLGGNIGTPNDFQKDLANQIIVNATIACRKYSYFKVAVWFTLASLISPIGVFALLGLRITK